MAPLSALERPAHAATCSYGSPLFPWVPGDAFSPFAALWQATLSNAALLAVAALILLLIQRSSHRLGIRILGFVSLAASLLGGVLTAIILPWTSTSLPCDGVPGASATPFTAVQQHTRDTFSTLQTLTYVAFSLTIVLVVVFLLAFVFVVVTRGRQARARANSG